MKFGYTIVWVADVERTVSFYEAAFDLDRRFIRDMGAFQYAEMETGDTTLAFASFSEAEQLFPEGFKVHDPSEPPVVMQISFVTSEVEKAFVSAVEHGATPLHEPHQEPWGQTISRVRDPNGILVSIVSPLG